MSAQNPLLEVRHLRVEFPTRRGTLVALDDVSFTISAGEVLGVVGESGAGKSMTGAAIIGLLEPPGRIAAGEILLDGRRIDNLRYEDMRRIRGKDIGAIFQDPLTTLNPLYTVGRQLAETMTTHLPITPAEARKRAIGWLDLVGIPAAAQRIDSYPHEFSGGQRQRLAIARALMVEPDMLVLDESTSALDVTVQKQVLQLLQKLQRERGLSYLLITHDVAVIRAMAHQIMVMKSGEILESGPAAQVLAAPQHPYTQLLVGQLS